MELIKFCGKDKKDSLKKAVSFFYDNYHEKFSRHVFFAKCRLQNDGKTIHFYPNMTVVSEKLDKIKKEVKK